MSYLDYENSVQSGQPVHLYEFTYAGTTYRLTDISKDYVAMSQTWEKTGLIAGKIMQSRDLKKENVTISLPITNSFASVFFDAIQDTVTTLTIYRGHRNDPDQEFITYWSGNLVQVRINENLVVMDFQPRTQALRRPGLSARFTGSCRHALYGRGCGLDKDDSSFSFLETVESVNGLVLTVNYLTDYPDGFFTAGMLQTPTGDFRFIRNHVGPTLTITKPHNSIVAAVEVTLHPGCDKTPFSCINKFNNYDNYGGFPYIPGINPFKGISIV